MLGPQLDHGFDGGQRGQSCSGSAVHSIGTVLRRGGSLNCGQTIERRQACRGPAERDGTCPSDTHLRVSTHWPISDVIPIDEMLNQAHSAVDTITT